jgi:hypothetical protein
MRITYPISIGPSLLAIQLTRPLSVVDRFTEHDDHQPEYLSTVSDKVHCTEDELFSDGGCPVVEEHTVEETDDDRYRKVPAGCGFSGLSYMKDNTVVGILGCLLFDLEYEKDSEDKRLTVTVAAARSPATALTVRNRRIVATMMTLQTSPATAFIASFLATVQRTAS